MATVPTLRIKFSQSMQTRIKKALIDNGRGGKAELIGPWFLVDVADETQVHASGFTRRDIKMALDAYNNGKREIEDDK